MPRRTISYDELIQWMNNELHEDDDYRDCEFTSVLQCEEDEIGCNWTRPNLRGHGVPAESCQDRGNLIIERARQLFNVNWD